MSNLEGTTIGSVMDKVPRVLAVAVLAPADYDEHFRRADLIISHAGMGSIITALGMRKPIVILPRRGHLQETRNDHQFATVQHFGDRPGIFVAQDELKLPEVLNRVLQGGVLTGKGIPAFAEERLIDAVRNIITNSSQ